MVVPASAAMLKTVEKVIRKPGVPNPMTPSAKAEHAVVAQALHEVIGPRLKPDVSYTLSIRFSKICVAYLRSSTRLFVWD